MEQELKEIIAAIRPASADWRTKAEARTARLVMPPRALGRLHAIAERLCAIGRTLTPAISRRAFVVMAGDHGIAEEGVSAFPQAVTGEMIRCFLRDGGRHQRPGPPGRRRGLRGGHRGRHGCGSRRPTRSRQVPGVQGGPGYGQLRPGTGHEPPPGRPVGHDRVPGGRHPLRWGLRDPRHRRHGHRQHHRLVGHRRCHHRLRSRPDGGPRHRRGLRGVAAQAGGHRKRNRAQPSRPCRRA